MSFPDQCSDNYSLWSLLRYSDTFCRRTQVYDPSSTLGRWRILNRAYRDLVILIPYALNRPILGHGFGGFGLMQCAKRHPVMHTMVTWIRFLISDYWLSFCPCFDSHCQKARNLMTQDFNWVTRFCFFNDLRHSIILRILVTSISGLIANNFAVYDDVIHSQTGSIDKESANKASWRQQ